MKVLCLDTTHKALVVAIYDGDKLLSSLQKESWKKQSEELFPAMVTCFEEAHMKVGDLDAIVLTKGPGSYTGARIAMSVAKVFADQKKIPLYTISTFQMYAGLKDVRVVLDARAKRMYVGDCKDGQLVNEEIIEIEKLKETMDAYNIVGDTSLLGLQEEEIPFVKNFMDVKKYWERVDNVHALVPHYLKEEKDLAT